mgnify:CR=1 FL=1
MEEYIAALMHGDITVELNESASTAYDLMDATFRANNYARITLIDGKEYTGYVLEETWISENPDDDNSPDEHGLLFQLKDGGYIEFMDTEIVAFQIVGPR